MRMVLKLMAGLSFLVVLILGAIHLDTTGALLPSVPTGAAQKTMLSEELQREEQLFQGMKTFQRNKRAKLYVAEEVIAGRLSLSEALEVFRSLEGQRLPVIANQDVLRPWKMSEDEWLGQGIRYYVEQVLADRPDEAAAVLARLEKQLQELLAERQKRPTAPAETRTEERSR